jgi:hypothetical protein
VVLDEIWIEFVEQLRKELSQCNTVEEMTKTILNFSHKYDYSLELLRELRDRRQSVKDNAHVFWLTFQIMPEEDAEYLANWINYCSGA